MSDFPRDYEVLFIDDASTDRTLEVIAPYVQVVPLEVFRNEKRAGHGASLETLLRACVDRCEYPRRDVVVTLQADNTDEPLAIPALVKRIEGGADLVVAAYRPNGTSLPLAVRWARRALPWLGRRYDLPEKITDPLSGLRAYRVGLIKRALRALDGKPLVSRDGWAANLELLHAVAPYARRVEETEMELRHDRRLRPSRTSLWRSARDYIGLWRRG